MEGSSSSSPVPLEGITPQSNHEQRRGVARRGYRHRWTQFFDFSVIRARGSRDRSINSRGRYRGGNTAEGRRVNSSTASLAEGSVSATSSSFPSWDQLRNRFDDTKSESSGNPSQGQSSRGASTVARGRSRGTRSYRANRRRGYYPGRPRQDENEQIEDPPALFPTVQADTTSSNNEQIEDFPPLSRSIQADNTSDNNEQINMESARLPTMSYPDATNYLRRCLETSNLPTKESIRIDLQFCDPYGAVAGERVETRCTITEESSLEDLILGLQVEVAIIGDMIYENNNKGPDEARVNLILKALDIETNDSMAGMPLIAGRLVGEQDNGTTALLVRWDMNFEEMENYWEMYKRWLLKSVDTSRSPPIFKVSTVLRQNLKNSKNTSLLTSGHHFGLRVGAAPQIADESTGRTQAGPSAPRQMTESPTENGYLEGLMAKTKIKGQPDVSKSELVFAKKLIAQFQVSDEKPSYSEMMEMKADMKRDGIAPTPELCLQPNERNPGEQPTTYGTYQRMGGDPESHALVDLENIVVDDEFTYQFTEPGDPFYKENTNINNGKARDPSGMQGGNAEMAPYFDWAAEKAKREEENLQREEEARQTLRSLFDARRARDRAREEAREEAARGFDEGDDAIFLKGCSKGNASTEVASNTPSAAVTGTQVATPGGAADQLNVSYPQAHGQTGHVNTMSGYPAYGGTSQYPPLPAPPVPPGPPTSFLTMNAAYRNHRAGTSFNPSATSWSSSVAGPSGGGPPGSHGFGNMAPTANPIFNPVVPNFQSQMGGNQPNPFQFQPLGHGHSQNLFQGVPQSTQFAGQTFMQPMAQGQNLFQPAVPSQVISTTNPFGNRENSPFNLRHPVRYQGGNVPVAVPGNAGSSTHSTPQKQSTTAGQEAAPRATGAPDAQYGTSMHLQNFAPPRANMSAILRGESNSVQAGTSQGPAMGGGTPGRGTGVQRGSRFFGNHTRGRPSQSGRNALVAAAANPTSNTGPNETTTVVPFSGPTSQG